MSAGMETQRLISVSLGKIAQSRCQRGGINLHRNLLVATVLHKARSAYMIDSYNYQQNLLQRQKQHYYQTCVDPLVVQAEEDLSPVEPDSNKGDVCLSSCEFINLGQPDATPTAGNDNELISDLQTDCETVDLDQTLSNQIQDEAIQNKENSPPPSSQDCSNTTIPVFPQNDHTISAASSIHQIHVSSSNQLSQEVQITLSTANPTCKVLKRSRSHIGNSSDNECSSTKQVKLSCETPSTDSSNMSSSTDVDLDTSESSQISNLVNIFNSGFSGLCAVSNESGLNSHYQNDGDLSSSQLSTLNKLRAEAASSSTFSRIMSEPSLLCSSQVNRLESLPSAIVLSA